MDKKSDIQPLDFQQRTIINKFTHQPETVSAINKAFVEERRFLSYQPPPLSLFSGQENSADLDEYMDRLELIEIDLKWLLSLVHQKFWCQIIYDSSCQHLIDTYLKLAPRPHDSLKLKMLPKRLIDLHASIHRLVFLTCLRMSTYKESKDNFLTQNAFGEIIYSNFLFDVPKLLDICVLYGKNPIVVKMMQNVFNSQPKYLNDFSMCIKDIVKSMETGKRKLRDIFDLEAIYRMEKKNFYERIDSQNAKITKNLAEVLELIYFLNDFVITLSYIIKYQPKIAESLFKMKFEHFLKEFMEGTLFSMDSVLDQMQNDQLHVDSSTLIKKKFQILKLNCAQLFFSMLKICCITPIVEHLDETKREDHLGATQYVDNFVRMISDILDDKRLLCYLEEKFELSEQIYLIFEIADDKIDKFQKDYIIDNLRQSVEAHSSSRKVKARFNTNKPKKSKPAIQIANTSATASGQDDAATKSMIQSVLDIFPDYDPVKAKKYLRHYNNNVDELINALLENKTMPKLDDENEPRGTLSNDQADDEFDLESLRTKLRLTDDLTERKNIYDGDQFDVFTTDKVDKSRIHQGKKDYADSYDMNDKEDLNRDAYANYNYVAESGDELDYDDEYDDTYDANIAVTETETDPMLMMIKPLNKKMTVKKSDQFYADESGEEEDSEYDDSKPTTSRQSDQQNQAVSSSSRNTNMRNQQQQQQQQRNQKQQQQQPKSVTYDKGQKGKNFNSKQPSGNQQQERQSNAQPRQSKAQRQQQKYGNDTTDDYVQPKLVNSQQQRQEGEQSKRPAASSSQTQRMYRPNASGTGAGAGGDASENSDNDYYAGPQAPISAPSRAKTEEEIKRERRLKNNNKAKVVHHNRREAAARKMNRGLGL